jgi:chromosome segregation ATPase
MTKQLERAQQYIIDLQVEITNLRAALAAATQRAEAAERNARQSDALAREYSAMQERTQRHAQDMEAVMLRWKQRAEAAEAVRLAVIKRNDELHNQVHRLKRQCGDLEAKLAAVPVDDICKAITQIDDDWHQSARTVRDWLDTLMAQSEVQP